MQILLCLFLFLLPWSTIWIYRPAFINGVKWEYGTLGFYGTEILLWVIIFLFMGWYWRQLRLKIKDLRFKITSDRIFLLSLLSLISYLFISTTWSSDKDLALQQSLRVMEAILLFLIIFIGPFEKEKLAKWFIYGAVIPSILGIWQFLTQSTFAFKWLGLATHPVWEAGTSIIQSDTIGRWLRAYGSFSSPNVFGGYLAVVIVTLLHCYIVSLRNEERGTRKALFLIPYSLFLIALFFTFSRSAWLATVIAILLYCYIVTKKHVSHITYHISHIILSFIIIFILSIIYFPLLQTRTTLQSTSEIRSIEERVGGYGDAWQIFKQHSIVGVGAGNYTYALYNLNSNRPGYEYQPVHNTVALFVVEEGMVGLLLVLFVVGSFITYHISHITHQKLSEGNNFKEGSVMCYVLCATCYVPLAFSDHYFYSSYTGLVLGSLFFALILAKKENNTNLV